jgi:hypothetical protein
MSQPQSKPVEPESAALCDAKRFASVLPDRDFVQMAETPPNKFKLSVAGALHPGREKGPKLEQVNESFARADALWTRLGQTLAAAGVRLPLTAPKGAGFNRARWGE